MVSAAAADGNEPVQMKLHKSLRVWSAYVDLEESLGSVESTRDVYDRMLDLKIATPQIILNYASFLEVDNCISPIKLFSMLWTILLLMLLTFPYLLWFFHRSTNILKMHLRSMKEG